MKILVIIVTYNAMQWAERCFNSLRSSSVKPDVFVVDNGSTDGTQAYIHEHYPEVMFQQSDINLGFGKANNIGLQYAIDNNYDYVYLLNQDAWVFDDTLELLVKVMAENPDYGVLSPLQYQGNGLYLDEMFLKCLPRDGILSDSLRRIQNNPYEIGMVMASHWMISRECLLKVGGFSTTFPHYGEDVNYKDRLNYWKYKIGVVPGAKAIHDREGRQVSREKLMYQYYMSELVYLSDPSEKRKPWIFNYMKNAIYFFRTYHTLSYCKYFVQILKMYSLIRKNKAFSKKESAFLNI